MYIIVLIKINIIVSMYIIDIPIEVYLMPWSSYFDY